MFCSGVGVAVESGLTGRFRVVPLLQATGYKGTPPCKLSASRSVHEVTDYISTTECRKNFQNWSGDRMEDIRTEKWDFRDALNQFMVHLNSRSE